MTIFIHHPGSGTTIDLAECTVLAHEPEEGTIPSPTEVGTSTYIRDLRHPHERVYLLAVSEGESWDDGTVRETVVLDSGSADGPLVLRLSGEAVKYFDNVHDLFTDIF